MSVSTSSELCPHGTQMTETKFVLRSSGDNIEGYSHTLNHTQKKNKWLSKMAKIFKCNSYKKRIFAMKENIIRISSSNVELAAIIMKDCLHESQEDVAVGGWGLKFLRKDEDCESCKESTSINVIVPAGFHGGPRIGNNNGPSSLVERWTSGGSCDCGGLDLGCSLTVLHAQPTCLDGFGEHFSFGLYVQGGKQSVPVLKMVDVSGDAYDLRYKSTLFPLQALSIAVATIHFRINPMMQVIVDVGASVSNKANEESSNEALMFISEDNCTDLDGMKRSILAKVKDLSVITDLLKYMSSEGFVDAINIESTKDKSMTDSPERKDDEGPSLDGGPEHEEPLDVDNCDSISSKDDNNDSDSSSEMSSTSRLMREDCMEKNLDNDVEEDIEDCFKNVTEKCGVVNNNMSNNVEGEIHEDHFDGDRRNDTIEENVDVNPSTNVYLDVNQNTSIQEVVEDLSFIDTSSDKAERLAHHNNGLDDLDISLRNMLLHQDKCRVRPVKAAVNDSSIVSPSTPPGTVLNLAEESCSTSLDYVGPLITDELDSEKRWSYRDPDGNVQGSFSLAQL
nr:hypothetical protein [Tanacetum cinerariifolium]